ncbi:MAG: MOSC domain-containing protein [Gammaproteobacteria bacterium]|nr:MOSC domain-containing protein [Gammaproteobacteria bacterium]
MIIGSRQGISHAGRLVWIGLRPARLAPLETPDQAALDTATGLAGDHYAGKTQRKRQVTLLQHEHLAVIGSLLRRDVTPDLLRRNLVVTGINLHALKDQPFEIGPVLLQGTGFCHPCSRMETALGPGGYQAMRGHGGITAQILRGGTIRLGDTIRPAQLDLFANRNGD